MSLDRDESQPRSEILKMVQLQSERNNVMPRLDLLAAAWGWSMADQAAASHLSVAELESYRHYDAEPPVELIELARGLERIQQGLWSTRPFGDYSGWWRKRWKQGSPINTKSPLEAIISGRSAVDILISHFGSMLSGDFT